MTWNDAMSRSKKGVVMSTERHDLGAFRNSLTVVNVPWEVYMVAPNVVLLDDVFSSGHWHAQYVHVYRVISCDCSLK